MDLGASQHLWWFRCCLWCSSVDCWGCVDFCTLFLFPCCFRVDLRGIPCFAHRFDVLRSPELLGCFQCGLDAGSMQPVRWRGRFDDVAGSMPFGADCDHALSSAYWFLVVGRCYPRNMLSSSSVTPTYLLHLHTSSVNCCCVGLYIGVGSHLFLCLRPRHAALMSICCVALLFFFAADVWLRGRFSCLQPLLSPSRLCRCRLPGAVSFPSVPVSTPQLFRCRPLSVLQVDLPDLWPWCIGSDSTNLLSNLISCVSRSNKLMTLLFWWSNGSELIMQRKKRRSQGLLLCVVLSIIKKEFPGSMQWSWVTGCWILGAILPEEWCNKSQI